MKCPSCLPNFNRNNYIEELENKKNIGKRRLSGAYGNVYYTLTSKKIKVKFNKEEKEEYPYLEIEDVYKPNDCFDILDVATFYPHVFWLYHYHSEGKNIKTWLMKDGILNKDVKRKLF